MTKEDNRIKLFFEELARYYKHENDLSNITVALCNSSGIFKEKFLHFFFKDIEIKDVKEITREVCDPNGMGSRVNIHISMKAGDLYIIEVKINDRHHHFGQYETAYGIKKTQFGYITNYYCQEGIELGYNVKRWEELYFYLTDNLDDKSDAFLKSYLPYLKKVCNFKIFKEPMKFKALQSIPQFFQIFQQPN